MKTKPSRSPQPLEGEGSYSAARKYNAGVAREIAQGKIEAGADEAREAVDGSEGPELRKAEASAKKGPRRKASPRPTSSAQK